MPPADADARGRKDEDLVAACRAGEPRAWHELVRRYRRLVYGIPRVFGLQPADTDEVFQLTFTSLLKSLAGLREPGRLEAWLVTTAKRNSLRVLRGARRRVRLAEAVGRDQAESTAPDPAEALERLKRRERVMRSVEALGEPCRSVVVALFEDPPRPYRDVARALRLPIGSLGPMRARCLDRLRARLLSGRGAEPDAAGRRPTKEKP